MKKSGGFMTLGGNIRPSKKIITLIHFVTLNNLLAWLISHQPAILFSHNKPASSTFLSQQTSHQQPASSTFLPEQTSTSHQPSVKRTG
jgi:antibiotic biosynthesis monooxygenase (ABM) superfamily enzyme